jgi:hypothetical protein
MSEHRARGIPANGERGQEPSLATATRKGVPARSPARQDQERER